MLPKTPLLFLSALSFFSTPVFSQKCTGQSCAIAALSGSTNESYEEITKASGGSGKAPTGSNSGGKACITKYYKELGLKAPGGNLAPGRYAEFETLRARRSVKEEKRGEEEEKADFELVELGTEGRLGMEKRQSCKAATFLFARGTTEPGTMGTTVGPALSGRLPAAKWKVEGVKYTADIAGDDCIGFPGGIKCVSQLEAVAKQCPETKLFVGGYSQGAMVARICAAYSKDDVKARIKGVVVFGDPFNGASIKGFPQDGIKTFCAASDGVCQGKFQITAGHLGYTMGSSIGEAAKWMQSRAG